MQRNNNSPPYQGAKDHHRATPSQAIRQLVKNTIKSYVPGLSCILSVIMYCPVRVLAADTCINYMCTESSGGVVAVYLTDNTPGCSSAAANYLVSKCGVGYTQISCNVDCSSIYAWNGGYWTAAGCTLLGNPCGPQGECGSSVLSVCQSSQAPAPSPTAAATGMPPAPSTSILQTGAPSPTGAPSTLDSLAQCCGKSVCTFSNPVTHP
jgi:hypothetical protein